MQPILMPERMAPAVAGTVGPEDRTGAADAFQDEDRSGDIDPGFQLPHSTDLPAHAMALPRVVGHLGHEEQAIAASEQIQCPLDLSDGPHAGERWFGHRGGGPRVCRRCLRSL